MNHPAQPAPEGATDAELDGLIRQMMTAAPHAESVSQHARTILRARLASESAPLRARCERLEGALISLKAACKDVLLPAINEAIKAGYKMETWTPEQFQWSEAMAKTDAALAQPEDGK